MPLQVLAVLTVLLCFAGLCYIAAKLLNRSRSGNFVWFFARCAAVFAILLGCELALARLFPSWPGVLREPTAQAAGGILRLAGMDNWVGGSVIYLKSALTAFDITTPCLGDILFLTYIALVFAQPDVTPRQRLVGLVGGLAVLAAFNICRIAFTVYVEGSTGGYVHKLFYYSNMAVVVLIWVGWVWTIKPRPARSGRTSDVAQIE